VDEPEAQLVLRCLSGDASAFEALYAAHAGRIAAYFLRSGFPRTDADDLTQETFTRAFRSLHTFDAARGAFRPWVATIARNVARKRWGRRAEPGNFDPELAEETLGRPDDPHARAQRQEEIDAVRECVARLPEPLGRIVRLRYVEGRSTRGVAAETGIPEATVRSRLAEAHERIERCLAAKGVLA
jgi:RNA polymerase sigma-70 factor (ECF subfamily)